jgi:predicted NBD/HSP70 family sugar kinase
MASKPFVGIDLGGTNMQIGVVSPDFKMLGEAKRKTKAEEGTEAIIGRIVAGVEEACQVLGLVMDVVGLGARFTPVPDRRIGMPFLRPHKHRRHAHGMCRRKVAGQILEHDRLGRIDCVPRNKA